MSRLCRLPAVPLLILSAALTAATLIWPVLAPLEWVSMVPMGVILLREAAGGRSRRRGLRLWGYGLCYFVPFFCAAYHWFAELYPLEFTGMRPCEAAVVVLLACVGLGLLHGALFALAFPLCGVIFRAPLCRRWPWLCLPLGAAVWCIFEWAQTTVWIGVPWARLALGQIKWLPVIQTASIGGSYFVTFLLVFVNLCLAEALLAPPVAERRVMAALLAFGINFAVGSGLYLWDEAAARERGTVVAAAVQGNISSQEKWDSSMLTGTMTTYAGLTQEAAAEGAELVIWPETTIPYTLRRYVPMIAYLEALADDTGVALLVGAFSEDDAGSYNTMYTVAPGSGLLPGGYSKRHLVPFGEYLPLADFIERFIPPLADLRMLTADIDPGRSAAVRDLGGVRVGSLICFDSIYESAARDAVRSGANLLAVSTNDSWFGDSAAVWQHNGQAILRAVETRRSVVRAANTGVSSIITPRGNVTASLDPLIEGQITAEVELCDVLTPYARLGNWIVWLAIAGCAAAVGSYLCRRPKKLPKPVDNRATA